MQKYTIKDIKPYDIKLFMGYMTRRLQYENFNSRKGISKKLGALISQYTSHFKKQPFEDFIKFRSKRLVPDGNKPNIVKEDNGYIYFIGNVEQKLVKIGFSVKPNSRLKSLQTSFPYKLSVLYKTKGSTQKEKLAHEKFKNHRLKGEWFNIDGDLKDFLKTCGVKNLL